MSEHEAKQALQAVFNQLERKQQVRRGLLGDSNGTVAISARPGWAYIRYNDNLSELAVVRYLIPEQLADGTPVVVGHKHPEDPYEQVLDVDWTMYAWSPAASTVADHATQAINLNDLSPGKVVPTDPASLSVDVRAFLYVNGDEAVEFGGGQIDLTGNVPGVAGHRLVLVYIDLSIDGLAAEDGAIVAVGVDAAAPIVPENGLPLGCVDLANGEATIEADDISQYKALYMPVGGEIALTQLGDYTRGYIIRGGAADWEAYDANNDGYALAGDGTDIVSTATPNWKDGTHTFTPGDDQAAIFEMDAAQSVDIFQIKDSGGGVASGADERGILFSDGDAAGANNLILGPDAGNPAGMSGGLSVVAGYQAGDALTSGNENVLIGSGAGGATNVGHHNVAVGADTMLAGTGQDYNVAIGYVALQSITTAQLNVAVGWDALGATTNGGGNVGLGGLTLQSNQSGAGNIAIGYLSIQGAGAGSSNTNYNVGVGQESLEDAQTGADYNVAVGYRAGHEVTTGANNVLLGTYAGSRQTNGSNVLLIDNQQRANAATELTHSLIYGVMGANPEDQTLTINTDALNVGTDADADVVMTWQANSNNGVLTWMEDEDYFDFDDTVKTSAGRIVNTTRIVVGDSPYTTVNADHVIFADTDGGAITVNLQAGVEGRYLRIINCGSSGNTVTVEGDGAETVWGAANATLNDRDILVIVYNATEGWW